MPVNEQQQRALAFLARAIRPHGARRWDEAGIVAAIGAVRHLDLAEVAMAVIVGAADRTLETPAAIGNTRSPLWQSGRWRNPEAQAPRNAYDPATACDECSQPEHRHTAASGHAFESVRDANRRRANEADKPSLRELLPTPDHPPHPARRGHRHPHRD